ncbi:hypothetical protein AVEN_44258-1 [Araneus ventricosus]|uniref:Uncharacterized protein n=1 Tax=Araneus ventricosus TaxID=182803 RepID=A0A4Y2P5R8_ARAVE|nr:hypothetical protein AVEN_44258-1 [Araneus ventricosus]
MALLRILQILLRAFSACISKMIELSAVILSKLAFFLLYPCDVWLWCNLNHVVSIVPIANLAELKTHFAQYIHNIRTDTLRSVVEHAISRFELVAKNGGEHIEYFLILSWWIGFQLRVPQLPKNLKVIVLCIDYFQ